MNLIESIVRKTIHHYINENRIDQSLLQQAANDTLDAIRNYLENNKLGITIYDNPLKGQRGKDNHIIMGRYLNKTFVIYDHYDTRWDETGLIGICILTHDVKYRKDSFDRSIPSIYDKGRINPNFKILPIKEIFTKLYQKLGIKYNENDDFNINTDNFRKNPYLKILNIFEKNPGLCTYIYGHSRYINSKTGEKYFDIFNELCKKYLNTTTYINPFQLEDMINYKGSENLKLKMMTAKNSEINAESPEFSDSVSQTAKDMNQNIRNNALRTLLNNDKKPHRKHITRKNDNGEN